MPTGLSCAVTGDFNDDGKVDVLLDSLNEDYLLFGTGKPSQPFIQGPSIAVSGDCPAVGDLNGDGILDFVMPHGLSQKAGTVTTFLGNGDGTFREAAVLNLNISPGTVLLADYNGDDKLDVAMSGNAIAFGDGDATFGLSAPIVTFPFADYFSSFATADLNGDGKPDIVSSNPFNGHDYVALNQGNGTFKLTIFNSSSSCAGILVATGDLNMDGHTDLAFSCNTNSVDLFLGNGDDTFREEPLLMLPLTQPGPLVIADLNGDGIPDLGVASSNTFGVYLGKGDGTFQTTVHWFGLGPSPQLPLTANLHGQGLASGVPDVMVPDATGLLGIYVNTTRH